MKEFIKTVGKLTATVLMCAVVAFGFMWWAMSLDTEPMREHSKAYAKENVGVLHKAYLNTSRILDTETDGLILEMAVYNDGETSFDRAIRVPKAMYLDIIDSARQSYISDEFSQLDSYLNGTGYKATEGAIENKDSDTYTRYDYGRYWHGFTGVTKVLLRWFDVYTVYTIFNLLLLGGLIWFMLEANKVDKRLTILPVGFIMVIAPLSLMNCFQFMEVSIPTLYLGAVLCKLNKRLTDKKTTLIFYCIAGCAINFFDLLTYPVAACMLLVFVGAVLNGWRPLEIIKHSLSWFCGYFGLWASKLILLVLYDNNLLKQTIDHLLLRVNNEAYAGEKQYVYNWLTVEPNDFIEITPITGLVLNSAYLLNAVEIATFALILAFVLFGVWKNRKQLSKSSLKDRLKQSWGLLLIPLLSIMWYLAMTGHSVVHAWFTWRSMAVAVLVIIFYIKTLCIERD